MRTIVERELTYHDDAGKEHGFSIKVHQPHSDGGYWACGYEIGAPTPFSAAAYGEDSFQALVMALQAVQAHLNTADLRGRVYWLGAPFTAIMELPAP